MLCSIKTSPWYTGRLVHDLICRYVLAGRDVWCTHHQMKIFSKSLDPCVGNSPVTDDRWAFMFSLICARTIDWVNHRYADDLRRHRTHYDVTVLFSHEITNLRLCRMPGSHYWDYYTGAFSTLSPLQVTTTTRLKSGCPKMKSTGIRSSNNLQWMVWYVKEMPPRPHALFSWNPESYVWCYYYCGQLYMYTLQNVVHGIR